MPPQHQVTLAEVAEAAGVSIATASRAINGSTRKVSEEIRLKVTKTAEDLGYLPNLSAQTVVKGASPTVAVLVSDIADPYFSTISSGIMAEARKAGLMVTMATSERRPSDELEIIRTFRSQRPRAIAIIGSRRLPDPQAEAVEDQLRRFQEAGGRVVLVSQGPSPFDIVELKNYDGARELAHSLVELGGRRFGVVLGHRQLQTNADRLAGFTQGLTDKGLELPEDAVAEGEFTRDGGYTATGQLIERGLELDTIFATSDLMALGAATALLEAGLEPGRDIGLAGFDNIALTEDVTPALTTVDVPLMEIGHRAMELALSDADEPRVVEVPTSVILGSSTPKH